jgi:hypothetical protein
MHDSMQESFLRIRNGKPTIYLIDEYHNCDACAEESIAAAARLFLSGVVLAGVEGYEGGWQYDADNESYLDTRVDADCAETRRIGDYPRFARALLRRNLRVVGVDCRGLADKIETDLFDGVWTGAIALHPNQRRRSDHFIRTLVEERTRRRLDGDLILNAGRAHNDHIADALKNGPLPTGWPDWQYVRLRCSSFDECL